MTPEEKDSAANQMDLSPLAKELYPENPEALLRAFNQDTVSAYGEMYELEECNPTPKNVSRHTELSERLETLLDQEGCPPNPFIEMYHSIYGC